jgi:hypothetical protein
VVGVVKSETASVMEDVGKVTAAMKTVEESEAARVKREAETPDPKKKAGGDPDPEVARLTAKLTDLENRDAQREAERVKATGDAATANRRAAFDRTAAKLGMLSPEVAFSHLQNQIQLSDDGAKAFVNAQREGFQEEVPLETWLEKEWLPSDSGKTFAPAGDTGGSGGRRGEGGEGGGGGGGDASTKRIDKALSGAGW